MSIMSLSTTPPHMWSLVAYVSISDSQKKKYAGSGPYLVILWPPWQSITDHSTRFATDYFIMRSYSGLLQLTIGLFSRVDEYVCVSYRTQSCGPRPLD